jgi:N-acyl-L-homoserine lactone synthetase
MQASAEQVLGSELEQESSLAQLFKGYRFTVCEGPDAAAEALDIRRRVYVDKSGYRIPVPDEYDRRSWFLLAHDVGTGKPVGSMRVTPRSAGPLEAEEYFTLPAHLRSPRAVEISRFAILPEYRKGKTFLPIVSVGLFRMATSFLLTRNVDSVVICSKPERVWTYQWLCFQQTRLVARYAKLDNAEHELLTIDFRRILSIYSGHPFEELLIGPSCPEVVMPRRVPALGIGVRVATRELRLAVAPAAVSC